MPEITGYADTISVKGYYYKLASSPKPVVFTGNIDVVSEELLAKSMFVSRGQVSGTLPNDFGNNFLIMTVKYGDDTYLQTAYLVQTNYECYEYRRIYSGSWTNWVGVDSEIKAVDSKVQSAKDTADNCYQSINGTNGINTQISTINGNINKINNTTIPGISNTVNSLSNRVSVVEGKTTVVDISSSYTITKTPGKGDAKWNSAIVSASRFGNSVNMSIEFGFNKGIWHAGDTPYEGTLSGGPLPIYTCRLVAYYGSSILMCSINPNGAFAVRVLSGTLAPGGSRDQIRPTGMFIFNS